MSSKVTAKLRLGAAFSVLLISLALLAGCKQEADNSYTPPGYAASVGPLTDTVWKSGSDTIRFGAEGKVVDVPSSWKKDLLVKIPTSNNGYQEVQADFNDFTYSDTAIYGKVTKASSSYLNKGDIVKIATFEVPTTKSTQTGDVTNYYEMKVKIGGDHNSTTFTMENKPTSGDKFVGTYYDDRGRKEIQINKEDGTFVTFDNGGQSIQYWKYQNDGTIYAKATPFDGSANEFSGGSTYYLYPHALMSGGAPKAWK
ncbi:MAG: hypothetical protein SO369_09300 [Treponema sp.]|nr:hypothetical protein [Treponema sp.]